MSLPKLTLEEKKDALKKAQLMRSKRSEIRQKLKSGEMSITSVLDSANDEVIGKMRVAYLLQSLPKIGKIRASRIMDEIGINKSRRIQGLGIRQKRALLERLG